MSMPKIEKSENPIDREQSVSNLIESVALMETGLSHIINAEGEKIQKVVNAEEEPTVDDMLKVNNSVEKMVGSISKLEMILQNKLDTSKSLDVGTEGPPGPQGEDGATPYIGPNGNWWINDIDTGVYVRGVAETSIALSASNLDSITFDPIEGMPIPLNTIEYSNGFTVDLSNTIFTVENTGTYLITYTINPYPGGSPMYFKLGLKINDIINQNTSIFVLKGGYPFSNTNSIILPLTADTTLQLVLFDFNDLQTVTLNDGVGASITAVKIT